MKLRWLAASAAVLITPLAAGPPGSAAPGEPETVCLVTEGQPDRERTLHVRPGAADGLIDATLSYRGPCAEYGERADLGDGELVAYSQVEGEKPVAVGLVMTDSSFDGLPYDPPTEGTWCFDKDGDGTIDDHTECTGGYERQLDLGAGFRSEVDSPFSYVLTNWNPHGHIPPGVYDVPHYDVHFYVNDNAERLAIRPGPCPQLVHCDDYARAKQLPEPQYVAPDHVDVDAVEPAMGNHLIDVTGGEFNGEKWNHSWIYGSYDGEITFYETMVSWEWFDGLRSGTTEDGCAEFKLPRAWQESGWYPTSYCLRHRDNRGEVTISLEDFVYRTAS